MIRNLLFDRENGLQQAVNWGKEDFILITSKLQDKGLVVNVFVVPQ